MWDSLLISSAKYPFWVVLLPIVCVSLFGLIFDKIVPVPRKFFYFAGILTSLITAIVIHLRWDSFSIHFIPKEVKCLKANKVLCLGDSITCEGTRPRGFITKLESISNIDVQIVCQKGASIKQIIELFDSQFIKSVPDLVLVQGGINDLLSGLTTLQIEEAQNDLVNTVSKRFPNSKILFIPIHPVFYKDNSLDIPKDLKSFWTLEANFADKFLTGDGIHLNAKGHTLLVANILKFLT